MTRKMTMNRRAFLKTSAVTGAGLLINFHIPIVDRRAMTIDGVAGNGPAGKSGEDFAPNAYLRIDPDGLITVMCPRSEMGQGVQTTAAMLIAEDLEADYSKIKVEQAPADYAYGDQITGGSTSAQAMYGSMRMAAARACSMLIAAAAQQWGVDPTACRAENSIVYGPQPDQKLTYGKLATAAAQQSISDSPELKPVNSFRVLGTRKPPIDTPTIDTGSAIYSGDVRLPNMVFAVVARCPVFGGKVASFDATKAKASPGVRDVVQIDSGVAVIAENTWAAIQGRSALQITWDEGPNAKISTDSIRQRLIDEVAGQLAKDEEAPDAVTKIEAVYVQPYMAHATMEPMSCVAAVGADSVEVWAPSQDRQTAMAMALRGSGLLSSATVKVHVPLIGCGWGRRINCDYVLEAAQISKQVGVPINLTWTRDDDIQHDFYRPMSYHVLRASLDGQGKPLSWRHYVSSEGIGGGSSEVGTGAANLPYKIKVTLRAGSQSLGIPVGYWRSVFNTNTAFVNETFMDELAAAAGEDPYQFRLSLIGSSRMGAVLKRAAEKSGWGTKLPDNWGRGIACYSTWGASYVAQVAEVSVEQDKTIHVQRVVCAVDCGTPLNLDTIEAQMEGGIIAGMSALFKHEITIKNGRVEQRDFRDYPVIRMDEAPLIEVYVIPSDRFPSGIGEMSNPVAPAAIANAIFAATGKRVRRLPISKYDLE